MTNKKLKSSVKLALCSSLLLAVVVSCNKDEPVISTNENIYSLTLKYNDEKSRPLVVEVEKGKSVAKPEDPIRTGYSFAGWFTAQDGGTQVNFPYTLSKDDVIYAHWEAAKYTVTFNYNFENASDPVTKSVAYKGSVDAITEVPERKNYVFRYWSSTADGNTPVTFPVVIKKDTTFYASWRDADITVYDVNVVYGTYEGAPESLHYQIEEGQAIQSSQVPTQTRTGFALSGWSLKEDGSELVTIPFTPTENCTLYAVWKSQAYTLSLRYNYTDSPDTFYQKIPFGAGDTIQEPTAPTREGYTFAGWYTTALGGTKVNFPLSTLKRNTAYFAHWTSNPVTTDIFDAEYVEFDPNTKYPGYSGEATGSGVIIPNDVSGIRVDNYPTNSIRPAGKGYYVSFQYMMGAQIIYNIEATEDLNNVKLYANWACELANGGLTFGPTGDNAYQISINNIPLNYTPATVGGPDEGAGQYKSGFKEYLLSTTVSLKKGSNTIILEPKNANGAVMGGTIKAVAPMTDYIRFDYGSTGKLSWSPVYDNLDGK